MTTGAPLRIVIPAYNEALRIEATLDDYCAVFAGTATICVVANGCTDETAALVQRLQTRYPNLELIDIGGKIGKGGAVRVGFATGTECFVGFTDADGSTTAAEFMRLFHVCEQSTEIGVIGSRWKAGAVVELKQPWKRRIASRAFNLIVRTLFGFHYADTQCGAKIFRRSALNEILQSLEVADFAFDIEVLWRLKLHNRRVLEVPTVWNDRATGTTIRLAHSSLKMLQTILRLRLRETPFWHLPFAEALASASIIPVKSGVSVLVVGYGPQAPRRPDVDLLLERLAEAGCAVTLADRVVAAASSARADRPRGTSVSTLAWYLLGSRREYDAVIEVESALPTFIPSFSAKPTFLITGGAAGAIARFVYAQTYRRARRIDLGADVAAAADTILSSIGAGRFYRAAFHASIAGMSIHYSDVGSGKWTRTSIR